MRVGLPEACVTYFNFSSHTARIRKDKFMKTSQIFIENFQRYLVFYNWSVGMSPKGVIPAPFVESLCTTLLRENHEVMGHFSIYSVQYLFSLVFIQSSIYSLKYLFTLVFIQSSIYLLQYLFSPVFMHSSIDIIIHSGLQRSTKLNRIDLDPSASPL